MLVKVRLSKLEIVLIHCTGQGVLKKIFSSVSYRQVGKNRCYLMSFSKNTLYPFLEQVILSYSMNSKRTWSVIISTLNTVYIPFSVTDASRSS